MKRLSIFIILSLILIGCKAKNAVNTNEDGSISNNTKPRDTNQPLPMTERVKFYENMFQGPQFSQIKISSKMNVESGNYIPTLDVTTYIEKDQKIWMNISALFINMARGMATPEGIKGFVRTEKSYIDSDFEYLNRLLNVNFIDYKSLEKMLMGRTFIKVKDSEFLLTKTINGYKMASLVSQKTETDGITRAYNVELFYSENYDLQRAYIKDANTPDELEITYSGWENFRDFRMPKNVKIIIKGSKNSQILMENTKFDDSKMQTPYSVPGSFKKIEIK